MLTIQLTAAEASLIIDCLNNEQESAIDVLSDIRQDEPDRVPEQEARIDALNELGAKIAALLG